MTEYATEHAQSEPTATPLDFASLYTNGHAVVLADISRRMYAGTLTFRTHYDSVNSWNGLNGVTAEDIAQEAWLRFWRSWPTCTFPTPEAAYAYLLRIARNLLIDQFRRKRISSRVGQVRMTDEVWEWFEDNTADDDIATQPEPSLIASEIQSHVNAAVERALDMPSEGEHRASRRSPDRDRALLDAWLHGVPLREVAEQLGMSEGSVKTRLWRIRWLLREHLQSPMREEMGAECEEVAV